MGHPSRPGRDGLSWVVAVDAGLDVHDQNVEQAKGPGKAPKPAKPAEAKPGEEKAAEAAFAKAAHRISLRLENNRVAPNTMEPRATLGRVDVGGSLLLHVGGDSWLTAAGKLSPRASSFDWKDGPLPPPGTVRLSPGPRP